MIRRSPLVTVIAVVGTALLSACSSLTSSDIGGFEQDRSEPTARSPQATAPSTSTSAPAEVVAGPERLGALTVEIVSSIPSDARLTHGLAFYDDQLLESVSQPSGRRSLDPITGEVDLDLTFPENDQPGGIAVWEGLVIQVSSESGTIELIDPGSLTELATFEIEEPARGVCAFAEEVVVSNGTPEVTFRDPMSFTAARSLTIADPLAASGLGELACANGQLWAITVDGSIIARIDIITGEVVASLDLAELEAATNNTGPISGLTYRSVTDTFFVTGDGWNSIVEVRLATAG